MSQSELTDGKNCVLPTVTCPRKSVREEQIRKKHNKKKIGRLAINATW